MFIAEVIQTSNKNDYIHDNIEPLLAFRFKVKDDVPLEEIELSLKNVAVSGARKVDNNEKAYIRIKE